MILAPRKEAPVAGIRGKPSGDGEWYTPAEIIEAARRVMGRIDLDPASCEFAQRTVKAERYFTAETDGLAQEWSGAVWMNPPYSKGVIGPFIAKLIASQGIEQAIVIVNNATDTKWCQSLFEWAEIACFTRGRVAFMKPDGAHNQGLHGQILFGKGVALGKFREEFGKLGSVLVPF